MPLFSRITATLLLTAGLGVARAGDLFLLQGGTTDALPLATFSQGSSRLPNFISDLVNGSGQFNNLANRQFVANLNYAGVANALRFNISQPGLWQANLSSPFQPGLINRQFNAPTRSQLESQIDAYLKKDGLGDLARFLEAMNRRSPAGLLDGNPNSVTAQTASQNFMEYGMRPTETVEESGAEAVDKTTSRTGVSMTADAGTFSSRGIEGRTFSWRPMIPIALGEARRVRLELALPLNYTEIEGADQYRVGAQLGLAVLVVKRSKDQPWLWQVTPHGGATVAGSVDMIAGGVVTSGGLTSYLSYRLNKWEFSMGNHFSLHEGLRVDVEDYTFDPRVSQRIYKNGLKIGRALGERWYAEVYALDTEFEREAFTSRYTTVGVGLGYRGAKRKGYVMIGAYTDFGPGYRSGHAQFGTGWKF